ncbi:hypothetical protein [Phormidesmis sp. 146-20]
MTPKATRDFIKRIFALASVAIAVFSLTTQRAIAAPFVLSDYSGNLYGQGTLTCSKDFYSPNPTRSPRNAMFFARANYTFVESYPRVGHDLKFQLNQTTLNTGISSGRSVQENKDSGSPLTFSFWKARVYDLFGVEVEYIGGGANRPISPAIKQPGFLTAGTLTMKGSVYFIEWKLLVKPMFFVRERRSIAQPGCIYRPQNPVYSPTKYAKVTQN